MNRFRRLALVLSLAAALCFAGGLAARALAATHAVEALGLTIELSDRWTEGLLFEIDSTIVPVFEATRENGLNTLRFVIAMEQEPNPNDILPDNLEQYDEETLQIAIGVFEEGLRGGKATTLSTANSIALCWQAWTDENDKYYAAYLRHGARDIYIYYMSLTGRGLLLTEYKEFQKIVASVLFGDEAGRSAAVTPAPSGAPESSQSVKDWAANAKERAGASAPQTKPSLPPATQAPSGPSLGNTRAFMDALEADLLTFEVDSVRIRHVETVALANGSFFVEYSLRYNGYNAAAVFECAPYGSIQSVDFKFHSGLAYLDDRDDRYLYDLFVMVCACAGFLRTGTEDAVYLMADLYQDILDAMDGWDTQEWIYRNGYGFFGTYSPETKETLLTIRVAEPRAM